MVGKLTRDVLWQFRQIKMFALRCEGGGGVQRRLLTLGGGRGGFAARGDWSRCLYFSVARLGRDGRRRAGGPLRGRTRAAEAHPATPQPQRVERFTNPANVSLVLLNLND